MFTGFCEHSSINSIVSAVLKLPTVFLSGTAENSSVSDELERAPIDAFKEKKVTFEENHKVFGDDNGIAAFFTRLHILT